MNVQWSEVWCHRGLWVSWNICFQGLETPEKRYSDSGESCTVCVSPWPGHPAAEDRGCSSKASLEQQEAWTCFFTPAVGVSDHLGGGALMLPLLLLRLTALWHEGGSWGAGGWGPATGGGGCGSHGRAGGYPMDNSDVPLHRLTAGHSPDNMTQKETHTQHKTLSNLTQPVC